MLFKLAGASVQTTKLMIIKVILACLIAEASSLCPVGYKYDTNNNKCHQETGRIETEPCPSCGLTALLQNLTRRSANKVIYPSKADLRLLTDKLKYAVKNFVDSEGMIDTYICPTAYKYDFDKKRCMPPAPPESRRYMNLGHVVCPHCNLKVEKEQRYIQPQDNKVVDLFDIPIYASRGKKSVADIIDKVLRIYPEMSRSDI